MSVAIEKNSVLVEKRIRSSSKDEFDVYVTSIYGCLHKYSGLKGSDHLTQQQASKLSDRVRDARVIDPNRWSVIRTPEAIDDAMLDLRIVQAFARLSQILLLKIRVGDPLSPQAVALLDLYLNTVAEGTLGDLRRAGVLGDRWPHREEKKAMIDMYDKLFGLWREEIKRAELAGDEPKSIRHAGYRIGIEHPIEVIGSGDDALEVAVSDYDVDEDGGLILVWIDHEYDGEAQ